MGWVIFVAGAILSWGAYGVFLNQGSVQLGSPLKALLCVGIAYFLTAVLAPLALLVSRGANWDYPGRGMTWSLIAGIVGAIGAFGVLLAFGAGGRPAVVMSIISIGV